MTRSDTKLETQDRTVSIFPLFSRPVLEWLFWLLLAAVVYSLTGGFDEPIAEYRFGAAGWPRALCAALAFGATGQLIYKLTKKRPLVDPQAEVEPEAASQSLSFRARLQRIGVFVAPFIYLYATPQIGFYVATPFLILAILLLLEVRKLKALAGVTFVVYGLVLLVFTRFFYVALPVGRIETFYDINNWIIALVRTGM
ncbi:tripartite tricarboxylate transporter TctB family protein [Pelagibius sp. Alg239-R121]|uniref:tripartite tricarboxylate transporter TctB family protein n=1 Tax=Pelagibius sp. Alg239-R121 TaxID=2993448 RepID=UPI0024A6EAA2|nr:tripartite tricarboxylate transporter TctB family protein [Pelagibius sp. Alg239-R121]